MQLLSTVARLSGAALEVAGAATASEAAARRQVSGASIDSRTVRRGEVFVALEGDRTDGHRFALTALERGAAAVLVRPAWLEEHRARLSPGWCVLTAAEPLEALQRWARGRRATRQLPVAAVTGSNGKTSTRAMLAHILASRGPVLATEGNLNNHLGLPLMLVRLSRSHWAAALEMGMSGRGEIAALCGIADPTVGVITNVGKAHLQQLGSVEEVGRAKSELADYLDRRGRAVVLNADDALLLELNRSRQVQPLTFGIQSAGADVRATRIELRGLQGSAFRLGEDGPPVELAVPGRHQVMNALAALATARLMGVPLAAGARALRGYRGGEHGRLEVLDLGGVTVLDDTYNSNPLSVRAGVELLRQIPAGGRRMAVLGDMLELGEGAPQEHEEAGRGLGGLHTVWAAGRFAGELARGAREAGVAEVEEFESAAILARHAAARVQPGDVLLVKGSRSMHMEQVVQALRERLQPRNA